MSNNVKLSNYSRDQIVKNAMHGAFEKEEKEIKKKLAKLAMDCYRSLISVAKEKAARQAPEEFLSLTNSVTLNFYDEDTHRYLACERSIEVAKQIPFFSRSSCGHLAIHNRDLYLAYKAIEAERSALHTRHSELRDSIKRTVYSTTSLKKLIEMWPEVEGFLPTDMTAPKPMLPALPVGDLNAALKAAGIKVGVIVPPKATGGLVAVAA